ncbi:MAG TPA: glucose-6-phosphate dehydrogenase, partial [Mycobacterium sp.]|nr:glucose-6-phosphate dehydrogenase [Mycobacterium sp.]
REDAIEETWRIVQPLLDKPSRIHHYDRGSWGPEAAVSLLHGRRSWQEPWLPKHTPATQ